MDLPGRRSHEYFPELSSDGKWLVWAATQRGHDHDTADYEIYLWQVGSPADKAVRLTHNSGNDRWPDLFLPAAAPSQPAPVATDGPDPAAQSENPTAGGTAAAPDSTEKSAPAAKADGQAGEKKKKKKKKSTKTTSAAKQSEPSEQGKP